jgi:MFS family permease
MKNLSETFSSLKVHNYRLYFAGQAASLCGNWMQTLALSWLVLQLTGSGTALGLVVALQFLPILIFGAWGGVIADRYNKRTLLYLTQSAFAVLALLLGILVATNLVQLWMVYVIAVAIGLVNAVDNPTRQTFVVEMVQKEQLPNAVTLNATQLNAARIVGPAIAGILIATIGIAWCFILNGISFIGLIIALLLMRTSELHTVRDRTAKLLKGFRYILSTPVLWTTLLMVAIVGTFSYEFIVSLPLLAQFTFHGDASTYAALNIAMGLGALIGGLLTATRMNVTPKMLAYNSFLFGLCIVLASVMPTFQLELVALVLVGIFSISMVSISIVILQLNSEPNMRSRVMSLWTVAFLGSTPIGGPIIGWIGEHLSPRWCLVTGGTAAISAAFLGYLLLKNGKE